MSARLTTGLALCGLALIAPLTPVLADPPAASGGGSSVVVTGEAPAKTDTTGKITDPKHPDFVRCRSEPVLNSRAQRVKVCRTNKEWAAAAREGNRQTQELLNAGRPLQPLP